ncbi:MAG: polysaccharide deacetylase family protein [Desulfobulbaceae bacterium]|nr:polysaccharide deacetylase family protein [Desulfobulbaceae bacterium]
MPLKQLVKNLLSPIVIYRFPASPFVFLTFDDGPDPQGTPAILKILDETNTKATFFLEGRKMEQYPHVVREIHRSGHALAYHAFDHRPMNELFLSELIAECQRMKILFRSYGQEVQFFRPPYGKITILSLFVFGLYNKRFIQWSVDSGDSLGCDAKSIVNRFEKRNIQQGDIFLFHDDAEVTPRVLREIIIDLRESGFSFGSLQRRKDITTA